MKTNYRLPIPSASGKWHGVPVRHGFKRGIAAILILSSFFIYQSSFAFEGIIKATVTRGGQTETWLYTVGTNQMRIERGETDRPYPKNIVDRDTGAITLLFPHNRSFVQLPPETENNASAATTPPGSLPPVTGPQTPPPPGPPGSMNPGNLPGVPNMPQMPMAGGMPAMPMMMPPRMMERMELVATTDTTNLLGYPCTRYEIKSRGQVMEIWATDRLMPFQPYLQNHHRFGPQIIEEQWGKLLKAKKLFPLLAVLNFYLPSASGNSASPPVRERMRFEIQAITPQKITDDTLFRPPPDYQEVPPLLF